MIDLHIHAATVTELHKLIRDILGSEADIQEEVTETLTPMYYSSEYIKQQKLIAEKPTPDTTQQPIVQEVAEVPVVTPVIEEIAGPDGLDSAGIPWDARIHSTKFGKNADLTWKILRRPKRFDANPVEWTVFIQDVLKELSGKTTQSDITAQQPTQSDITAQQPIVDAPIVTDFPSLMAFVTTNKDKVEVDAVVNIAMKHLGITNDDPRHAQGLMLLFGHDELIPAIFAEIQVLING